MFLEFPENLIEGQLSALSTNLYFFFVCFNCYFEDLIANKKLKQGTNRMMESVRFIWYLTIVCEKEVCFFFLLCAGSECERFGESERGS